MALRLCTLQYKFGVAMSTSPTIYQDDFYGWIDRNIMLLKQKQWADTTLTFSLMN